MTDETADQPQDDANAPPNAATAAGVERQRKRKKGHDDLVREFWTAVLNDPIGRAEIWRILSSGGVFNTPFACGPGGFPQPEATWFKAGQQALVLGEFHRLQSISFAGVHQMLLQFDPRFKDGK